MLHRRELTPGTVIMVIIGVWEITEPGCPRRTATNSVFWAQVTALLSSWQLLQQTSVMYKVKPSTLLHEEGRDLGCHTLLCSYW